MLALQILVIPIVVIFLLSTIFVIASQGLGKPGHFTRDEKSAFIPGVSDSAEPEDQSLPGTPFVKI